MVRPETIVVREAEVLNREVLRLKILDEIDTAMERAVFPGEGMPDAWEEVIGRGIEDGIARFAESSELFQIHIELVPGIRQ